MLIIGTRIKKALLSPALKSFTDNKDDNSDFWRRINGKSNDMNFNRQKFNPDKEQSTQEKHMRRVLSRLISRWPSLIVSFYEKLNCHLCKTKLNCFDNLPVILSSQKQHLTFEKIYQNGEKLTFYIKEFK